MATTTSEYWVKEILFMTMYDDKGNSITVTVNMKFNEQGEIIHDTNTTTQFNKCYVD